MPPIDPSPYRTIASALAVARANRQPIASTPRSRATLRAYLDRTTPSTRATDERDKRVADAVANRFRDTHGDYATSHPHVAPGFRTER